MQLHGTVSLCPAPLLQATPADGYMQVICNIALLGHPLVVLQSSLQSCVLLDTVGTKLYDRSTTQTAWQQRQSKGCRAAGMEIIGLHAIPLLVVCQASLPSQPA